MKQPSSPRSHAHHRSDIGRLRRAGPWALAEAFISAFATFLSTLIVARILTPHDFGLATIAFAVVALIQMIALAGLPEAMLRMPTLVTAISDQVFWTMLFFGIAGTAIGWMIAWPLALFYESPLVFWLIAVQAVDCVLLALIQFPTVLLTRKMRIRSLAVRALGFKAASIAVTIAVAFAGGGPWALVAGTLTGSVVSVVMLWTTQSRLPSWRPPGREIAGILRTSALIMAEASLTSLAIRGFILLFGKFHGLAALGLLNFANRLVDELGNMLSSAVNRVAVTFLSSIRRKGGSLVRAFELGSFGMTALVAPMFFGLAALAGLLHGRRLDLAGLGLCFGRRGLCGTHAGDPARRRCRDRARRRAGPAPDRFRDRAARARGGDGGCGERAAADRAAERPGPVPARACLRRCRCARLQRRAVRADSAASPRARSHCTAAKPMTPIWRSATACRRAFGGCRGNLALTRHRPSRRWHSARCRRWPHSAIQRPGAP
jgi:hypothetical protein